MPSPLCENKTMYPERNKQIENNVGGGEDQPMTSFKLQPKSFEDKSLQNWKCCSRGPFKFHPSPNLPY